MLQVIKHLQHLFFSKIEVAVAIGRICSTASATGEELVLEEITSQPGSLLHPPRLMHVLYVWLMQGSFSLRNEAAGTSLAHRITV